LLQGVYVKEKCSTEDGCFLLKASNGFALSETKGNSSRYAILKSDFSLYNILITLTANNVCMKNRVKNIFEAEAIAIKKIPVTDSYEKAVEIIYKHVHTKDGKLVTSGMGKAGQVAHNIATTFSSTGTPAVFLHPSEAQHGDLGVFQKNDVLLVISNSGKTREIIELLDLIKNLYPGVPVIVVTGNEKSPLAEESECTIYTGGPEEVCILGLTPTTSTTVMTVIGDALVVLMMEKVGFNSEEYSKRHHGGYLGAKSRIQSKKG
jgi:arabinose-5-phosphate isomerase